MTKRSQQAASRYARRSGQGKAKRQPKSHPPLEAKIATARAAPAQAGVRRTASQQTEEVQPKQATEPMPKTSDRLRVPAVAATYAYIASDLKRTGIIAVAIFVLLIVLAIIFG
ncbi:hypothetical protein M1N88_00335 [Dehalococcoidia bacterium]|nr:hypothetical protein [Dehalococcoidia bacterium]